MPFDFQRARPLLHAGELTKLFVEELGWEPCRQKLILRAGETDYAFTAIAEKRGFTAWLCARADGSLPDHTTRLKLDRALAHTSFEHLIVFATPDRAQQSWVWVRREPGRPLSARTHEFNRAQPGDSLLQKLQVLYVSLEEEEQGGLLRGAPPVIICPARGLPKRIPPEWKKPLADGRLLILSIFPQIESRITAELAARRNELVAALADQVFVAYATPGGRLETSLRQELLPPMPAECNKLIATVDDGTESEEE